jgi:hypothetical protein
VPNNSNDPGAVALGLIENSRHLPKGVPNNSNDPGAVALGLIENSRHLPKGVGYTRS